MKLFLQRIGAVNYQCVVWLRALSSCPIAAVYGLLVFTFLSSQVCLFFSMDIEFFPYAAASISIIGCVAIVSRLVVELMAFLIVLRISDDAMAHGLLPLVLAVFITILALLFFQTVLFDGMLTAFSEFSFLLLYSFPLGGMLAVLMLKASKVYHSKHAASENV